MSVPSSFLATRPRPSMLRDLPTEFRREVFERTSRSRFRISSVRPCPDRYCSGPFRSCWRSTWRQDRSAIHDAELDRAPWAARNCSEGGIYGTDLTTPRRDRSLRTPRVPAIVVLEP